MSVRTLLTLAILAVLGFMAFKMLRPETPAGGSGASGTTNAQNAAGGKQTAGPTDLFSNILATVTGIANAVTTVIAQTQPKTV